MIIGIVGLPKSGKTTVFNAVTGSKALTAAFSTGEDSTNVAMVKVPDPRLDKLHTYYPTAKKVGVELKFIDFAPFQKGQGEKGFPAKHLGDLRSCDALVMVVRAFEDEGVPHPDGSVDAARDLENLLLELALADLEVVDKRIERIAHTLKRASKEEKAKLDRENAFILRLKEALESGAGIGCVNVEPDEVTMVRNFGFLTTKPLITVVNIHEDNIGAGIGEKCNAALHGNTPPIIELPGKIEMELAALEEEERAAFMEDLGLKEAARGQVLRLAWKILGLIVFFTVGNDEVRAWPVKLGDDAVTAAGKIHSDIARGFIRAEVYPYDDFVSHNGLQGVKDAGLFRLEGKEYVVKDGDIAHFRFNV